MTKQTITATLLSLGIACVLTTPARAGDIVLTLSVGTEGYYDSPDGYDYSSPDNLPPAGATIIGTFTGLTVPAGNFITGISISGTFGNGDSDITALSDYYLGDSAGDTETAVEVAGCDEPTNSCSEDISGITSWSYELTPLQIAGLANGLAGGSLDFTYTWDSSPPVVPTPGFDQYVYAGEPTIDVSYATPEPATVLFCFSGLAGILAVRRFRKA